MTTGSGTYTLSHIRYLEAESIHVMREVAAEFERPVMLYSVGKDSSVLLRLAQKAFAPGSIPFPLLARRHGVQVHRDVRVPRPRARSEIGAELSCAATARRSPRGQIPSTSARSAAAAC